MVTGKLIMKRRFAAVALMLLVAVAAGAQEVKEYFSLKDPLVFDGTEYHFAFSANPGDAYYLQEYLPEGDDFDHYTSMFTIALLGADVSPLQAVQSKMAELDARKKVDSICNYVASNLGDEYYIDFTVSDVPMGDFNTLEFDVHRYFTTTIDGKDYLALLFYSERAYEDDILDYLENLKTRRTAVLSQMSTLPIPVFQLSK